eukprot:scaffold21905_cov31-Tisochrysis_lutea.AAC.2
MGASRPSHSIADTPRGGPVQLTSAISRPMHDAVHLTTRTHDVHLTKAARRLAHPDEGSMRMHAPPPAADDAHLRARRAHVEVIIATHYIF